MNDWIFSVVWVASSMTATPAITAGAVSMTASASRSDLIFDHLGDEFDEFVPRFVEHLASRAGRPIILPAPPPHQFYPAPEIAKFLQQVQGRIEGSGANPVTVANQLFRDLRSEGRLLGRMIQNVQTDEAVEKVPRDWIVCHGV